MRASFTLALTNINMRKQSLNGDFTVEVQAYFMRQITKYHKQKFGV